LWLPPHDLLRSPRGWGLLFSWHIKSCNPAIFTQPRMHLSHHMLIHNITTQIQLNKIENINFFPTSWSQDDQGHLPFEGGHYFVAAPGVWVACTHPRNSSWPQVLRLYFWWDLVISDTQNLQNACNYAYAKIIMDYVSLQLRSVQKWFAYLHGDDDELGNSSCSFLTNSGVWRGRTWSMSNSSSSCIKKHHQSALTYLNHT
jgi:hypothetical protein